MKRRTTIQTVILVVCLAGAGVVARAELCGQCKGKMFITNLGKCEECGGRTTSGAKKLCPACSKKLGLCEACKAKLNAAKPTPAAAPAATSQTAVTAASQTNYKGKMLEYSSSISGQTVGLSVGDRLKITLPGNPTTGYSWSDVKIEGDAMEALGKPEYKQNKVSNAGGAPMVGVGGEYVFIFGAKKEGTATITTDYQRPWEKNVPAAKTFKVTATVTK